MRTRIVAVGSLVLLALTFGYVWTPLFLGPQPFAFYDLDSYRLALSQVKAGTPMYDALPYPPIAFLVIGFLAEIPVVAGNQLWTAAEMFLVIVLAAVISQRAMEANGSGWRADRWGFVIRASANAVLLVISMPLASQLTNGQVSLLVITLAFLDVAQVLPKRFQGVLVGLAGAIKVTPLIFVPYYLVTGQRRQAAVAMGTFVAVTALGFVLFPSGSLLFWTRVGGSSQFGDPTRPDNLSIHASLSRLSAGLGQLTLLWAALGLLVLAAAMFQARRQFVRGEPLRAAFIVGVAATVVAPVAWPHYFTWLPLLGLWLVMSTRRVDRWLGIGIYFAYSLVYTAVLMPLLVTWNPVMWVGVDVLVIIPVLIGVFGLPLSAPKPLDVMSEPHSAVSVAEGG